MPAAAEGVFDPYFERDGDATDAAAGGWFPASAEDWQTVNKMNGTNYPGSYSGPSLLRSGVVPDFVELGVTKDQYFASICKDVVDLSACTVKDDNKVTPDKDDIVNVAVAAYTYTGPTVAVTQVLGSDGVTLYPTTPVDHQNGDLLIFWMAELYAPNGDASIGGWITKEPFDIPPAGTLPNSGYTFGTSQRSVGDIFIEGDFYQSQQTEDKVTMSVFLWDPGAPGAISGTLAPVILAAQGMRCTDDNNALTCAISNSKEVGPVPTYWPVRTKGTAGQPANYPVSTFFEMGINLSATLRAAGRELGCYTNFLTETRASHSETADLKDIVTGSLPLCGISVDKSGDTLSKPTDPATYNIVITNTGVVRLYKQSIVDDVLGNLTNLSSGSTCGAYLDPSQSCTITVSRTTLGTDPDPLVNKVDVTYSIGPSASSDSVTASDTHTVQLFQPSVTIAKTGDTVSKIGDQVTYNFTITNTSSSDTPALVLDSITDTKLGNLAGAASAAGCGTLDKDAGTPAPASCSFSVNHTIPGGAADPYNNTVTVHYHPTGFSNDVQASDPHSVDLFQPAIAITKTGDTLSKIGDQVTYHFTITNNSSSDSPALVLDSITDTKLGNLAAAASAAGCGTLDKDAGTPAPASCSFDVNHTVPGGAADPYNNTVTVHYHPTGFSNDISSSEGHSVNLFQPNFTLAKSCAPTRVKVGDPLTYTYTIQNTGSVDSPNLNKVSVTDDKAPGAGAAFPATLVTGAPATVVNQSYYPMAAGFVTNNVSATYQVAGFSNQYTKTASATCEAYVGDQGCTPGFWKNHPEYWDGLGTDDKTATVKHQQYFNVAFDGMYNGTPIDVTSAQSGLSNTATLMDAVNLQGGGLKALNRHAAAALASADSVDYPYSVQGVKILYWDAVGLISGPENVSSALKKLSDANELRCPY